MADNTLDAGLPRSPHDTRPVDLTRDPDFVNATPEQKHSGLSNMNSPYYDPHYASAPPALQQKYIQSLSPGKVGATETVPVQSQHGGIYQATKPEAALRDWSGPIAKILASTLAANAAGAAAGGSGLGPSLARPAAAGAVTGATEPGSFTDKLVAGLKGAGWAGLGELGARAGNAVVTSPSVSRFGSRMTARPADPGTPPSNPITSATVMHDMGSQQPAGSAFAPRPILGPNGQAVSSVNAPVVDRNLQAAAPGTPTPIGPAKDLLVQRTPSPGTPPTPENVLSRVLRTGAPSGAAQDPNVQQGMTGLGLMLANILSNLGHRWGFTGGDPNHTGPGAGR